MHKSKGENKLNKKVWEIPELNELGVRYTAASSNLSTSFRKSKPRRHGNGNNHSSGISSSSSNNDSR